MRRIAVILVAVPVALLLAGPAAAGESAKVAALQVALRSKGMYAGAVDGVSGPMTRSALIRFQRRHRIRATGKLGHATRCEFGRLGKPLLGQRELRRGLVGWDVAVARVPAPPLRAPGAPDRRPLRRSDGRRPATLPAGTRSDARRDGRRQDVPGARARACGREARAQGAPARRDDVPHREPRRRLHRHRAALSRPRRVACPRQRSSADERPEPGTAASGAGSSRPPDDGSVRPPRSAHTSCTRERASSRSPSATTSVHGGSPARTGFR